jgi:hypothetical protein
MAKRPDCPTVVAIAIMEVITSEQRFWDACPCAALVAQYASDLMPDGFSLKFGRAVVRTEHVSTMFVCLRIGAEPQELWISARPDGQGGWMLRHTPLQARHPAG